MAITVEAVYENGVLKLSEPLPWKDGARVRVEVSSLDSPLLKAYGIMGSKLTAAELEHIALHPDFLLENARDWVHETHGICGWKGSAEEADRFANDPELDFSPPPDEP